MIDNTNKNIYQFSMVENGKTVSVTIDNTNGTWVSLLREFTGFMAASYNYDISNNIGIREYDFNDGERNEHYTPLNDCE